MNEELRQDLLREVLHAREQLNVALQALDHLEALLAPFTEPRTLTAQAS